MRRPFDENDPVPVDFGEDRRHKDPKALKRLRRQFTYDKQISVFWQKYDRAPASETELEVFCEEYLIAIYNGGFDTI